MRYEVRCDEAKDRWFRDFKKAIDYFNDLLAAFKGDITETGKDALVELIDVRTGEILYSVLV